LPEIHDEPVFDGYRNGGCRSGGGEAPENVMKNNDFYRAQKEKQGTLPVSVGQTLQIPNITDQP